MKNSNKIHVTAQPTPNPDSMKFMLSQKVTEEYWETDNSAQAGRSPLAQKIMGFPWVDKVFIGPDFITINKQDWVQWETLIDPLCDMIREHIESKEAVLNPVKDVLNSPPHSQIAEKSPDDKSLEHSGSSQMDEGEAKTIQQIKHILETDIQPAVAMDGGFISFEHYKDGQVFLKMQGACSGCPSASMTLKQGIETHLKKRLPLVKEVIAI